MTEDTSTPGWVAVGELEGFILALEWKRGEVCPRPAAHAHRLREARTYMSGRAQQGELVDSFVVVTRDLVGDVRKVGVFDPMSAAWHPYAGGLYPQ